MKGRKSAIFVGVLSLIPVLAIARVQSATANPQAGGVVAFVGAKIYTSPTEPPIPDGTVVIHGGKIEAVGTRREIEAHLPKDARVIDAGGRVVAPGFVDAHTHLVFAGNRAGEFEMR